MDWQELDALINELDELVRERKPLIPYLSGGGTFHSTPTELVGFTQYDWRPVKDKVHEIRQAFRETPYPTRQARDHAWIKFNNLQNEVYARSSEEQKRFRTMSEHYRDEIIKLAESARYRPLGDGLIFKNTYNDMRQMAGILRNARSMMSENQGKMLREHKEECRSRIEEIKITHDKFWDRYDREKKERREQHEARMRDEIERRTNNVARNKDRLTKSMAALERVEENISDLYSKISSAWNEDFKERAEGWLAEAEAKRDSINETISQLEERISKEETIIQDIYSRLRS